MFRSSLVFIMLFALCGTALGQLAGEWAMYKRETEQSVLYPQESWQLDTLIFTATTFERRFLKQQKRYQFKPASIKGTYELTSKKIVFISNQNLSEVEETSNYKINQFGELMIGEWIYPVYKDGERDYRRNRFRVWTYYRKIK